jgi:hypothetical protein
MAMHMISYGPITGDAWKMPPPLLVTPEGGAGSVSVYPTWMFFLNTAEAQPFTLRYENKKVQPKDKNTNQDYQTRVMDISILKKKG